MGFLNLPTSESIGDYVKKAKERKEGLDRTHDELTKLKKQMEENPQDFDARAHLNTLREIFITKECPEAGFTDPDQNETRWNAIETRIYSALLQETKELSNVNVFVNDISNLAGFKALTNPDADPDVAKSWFDKISDGCKSALGVSVVAVLKLLKEFEGLMGVEKDADGNVKEGWISKLYKKFFIYSGEHKTKFEEYKKGIALPKGFKLEGKYKKRDVVEMAIKNSKGIKVGRLQFNPSGEQITLILENKDKTSYSATNAEEINEYLTAKNLGAAPTTPPPAGEAAAQTAATAENPLHQGWVDKLKGLKADNIVADLADLKSIKAITEDAEIDQLIENANLRDSNFDKVIKVVAKKIGSQSFEVRLADLYLQKRSTDDITLMTSIINGEKSEYKTLDTSEKIREFLIKSYRKPTLKEAIKDFEKGSA